MQEFQESQDPGALFLGVHLDDGEFLFATIRYHHGKNL